MISQMLGLGILCWLYVGVDLVCDIMSQGLINQLVTTKIIERSEKRVTFECLHRFAE